MSLFKHCTESFYPVYVDNPVDIRTRYIFVSEHPAVSEALRAVECRYDPAALTKSNLLEIWEDDSGSTFSFNTKFLATLFWGHIFPVNLRRILNDPDYYTKLNGIQSALLSFLDNNGPHPYDRIRSLYSRLETGDLSFKGMGVAFFTKLFFFFFATHRTLFSENGTLPVIADVWMRKALYAEMAEEFPKMLSEVFRPGTRNPCGFRYRDGDSSQAYYDFLKVFDIQKNLLAHSFEGLDSLRLEGYLFASKDAVQQAYLRALRIR